MRTATVAGFCTALVFGMATSMAYAQRGVGDPSGVARQAVKPEIVTLSGRLIEIKTGPCEATTGRSPVGTHIILETPDGKKFNIHLGPADVIADKVAKLSVGQDVAVQAFRTDKLKAQDFVAQSLTSGGIRIELRDAELRPVWAPRSVGTPGFGAGRGGPGHGYGPAEGWEWAGWPPEAEVVKGWAAVVNAGVEERVRRLRQTSDQVPWACRPPSTATSLTS